jgi:methionine sulfoxide reductase heme-binding subunit
MHLTSSSIDWYAARAAGIVAYLLLTAVVSVGVGLAGRMNGKRWPRFAVEDVHRFGGILVGTFVAIHVATIAIDSYMPFSLSQLVVPLTSRYRPIWTALGIVAAELLLALAVANRLRGRMPYRWWRVTHYLNFVVWAGATVHGIGAGSDRGAPWMIAIYAVSVALVLVLLAHRVGRPRLVPLALAIGLVPVLLAVGPLHHTQRIWNDASFSEQLTGRILQQQASSAAIVSMTGSGSGEQAVLIRADLLLTSGSGERTAFRMEYLRSGQICSGTVSAARAYGFDGVCRMPDGSRRAVTAHWHLTDGANLAGTVTSRES